MAISAARRATRSLSVRKRRSEDDRSGVRPGTSSEREPERRRPDERDHLAPPLRRDLSDLLLPDDPPPAEAEAGAGAASPEFEKGRPHRDDRRTHRDHRGAQREDRH